MAKHNEIVNNLKGHLEHFDFNHKEQRTLTILKLYTYLNCYHFYFQIFIVATDMAKHNEIVNNLRAFGTF